MDACANDVSGEPHKVIFSIRDAQDHVQFSVYDNGIGMDSETKEKIFTLFYSSKGVGGTGLGLFISNEIVRQHGGTIGVNSVLGQGSQFSIRLPKKAAESDQNSPNRTRISESS